MNRYCFGIDLGGTTVKMGLFTVKGENLDKWEIPTRTENNGAAILGDIAAAVKAKMEEKGILAEDVAGLGIGVPGPVINERIVNGCVNLGWGVFDVAAELSALTSLPVKAANDANVAALGEQWLGGGKGYDNVVMVTLGTGVGGGIICKGRILDGADGGAGEIGHMNVVDPSDLNESDVCNCGHRGCLELAASATGIVRLAKKRLADSDEDSSIRDIENLTAKDVLDAYKAGDALAGCVVEKMMYYLGKACSYIGSVVNPQVFVIGGGVSKAGECLTEGIGRYYKEMAFGPVSGTGFALATLGNDAGIVGAARLVCIEE